MAATDYKLLYESTLAAKQELDAQHKLLGEEVKRLKAGAFSWIDPNDKTQKQFLPHIGEPVLFCHGGVTYYGVHTGGSFKAGHGVTARLFGTWDCMWMYPPTAAQKGGEA